MFKILPEIYLVTGIGFCIHGLMTLDNQHVLYGVGLFTLAMVMIAALIFDVDSKEER
jgi:hypothetical protein